MLVCVCCSVVYVGACGHGACGYGACIRVGMCKMSLVCVLMLVYWSVFWCSTVCMLVRVYMLLCAFMLVCTYWCMCVDVTKHVGTDVLMHICCTVLGCGHSCIYVGV